MNLGAKYKQRFLQGIRSLINHPVYIREIKGGEGSSSRNSPFMGAQQVFSFGETFNVDMLQCVYHNGFIKCVPSCTLLKLDPTLYLVMALAHIGLIWPSTTVQ